MTLTIRQYIETLTNSDGRFRSLRKVYPVADAAGEPVFSVPGHGLVDFEIVSDGAPLTLRCPLRWDAAAETRLRALAGKDRGLASQFFTEWTVCEKEAVLFDTAGNPVEADILVRPSVVGVTAGRFLTRAVANGDTPLVMSALASLAGLAEWLRAVNREVSVRRLFFAPDGSVRVAGFSATGETGDAALAFFFTAAMPERFNHTGLPLITRPVAARPLAVRLCADAAAAGFHEPDQILAGDIAGPIARLASAAPERVAELGRRLSEVNTLPEPEEPVTGYDCSEDESDGIRCVRCGGGWRYVGRDGVPVSDTVWLYAAPFREGRAEVETADGKGLIDREGRYILEPLYEQVAWDDYRGLVAVMLEGRWSLLDRTGTMLTDGYYDWLGECAEGLILAQKGDRCGFLDAEGREAIPFIYDDATSFSDGVANVTLGTDDFLIDGKGHRVG